MSGGMPPTNRVTDESYEPNKNLRELLTEVKSDARLHYEEESTIHLAEGSEATRLEYTVAFDGFESRGTEEVSNVAEPAPEHVAEVGYYTDTGQAQQIETQRLSADNGGTLK